VRTNTILPKSPARHDVNSVAPQDASSFRFMVAGSGEKYRVGYLFFLIQNGRHLLAPRRLPSGLGQSRR